MTDLLAPQDKRSDAADESAPSGLPVAALADLPKVLVSPPWAEPRRSRPPREIPGLKVPAPQLVGRPGEFERAMALEPDAVEWDPETYWDDSVGDRLLSYRPEWRFEHGLLSQLARGGPRFADEAVASIKNSPGLGRALLAIRSTPAAAAAAHWCLRLDAGRGPGLDWFDRHGLHAVPLLVPEAFGAKGYQRTTARGALRLLAWRYGPEAVIRRAESHGPEAVEGVTAVLADYPDRPLLNNPTAGSIYAQDLLPRVLTADRAAVLPASAVSHLIAVLSQWSPRTPYPAVDAVAEACDAASLTRFSLAMAQRYRFTDWTVGQLARFGGPEAAVLLEAQVKKSGARNLAQTGLGLETLAAFPADTAFPALYRLSRGKLHASVRKLAAAHAAALADRAGFDVEPFADGVAPTLGLDDPAGLTLDFGPRVFHVKADDRLNLRVADADGRIRARPPRPGVRDDAETAAASLARFRTLTKDLAAEREFQSGRLKDAMLTSRIWQPDEFAHLTAHPVLAALARGLLWIGETATGTRAFRLAEDGSFADVDDKPLDLLDGARVRLAHPVLLGDDVPQWTEVFADYEILQPFDQLARPALTLTPEEAHTGILERFSGATATFGALSEVLDWKRLHWTGDSESEWDGGRTYLFDRELPLEALNDASREVVQNAHLLAEIDPSPDYREPDPEGRHRVLWVWFAPTRNRRRGVPTLRGDALDPVLVAEILAGLGRATGLHH
ncbi:DUF4132 domain-containing protein [Glycomyces algeriensis]|uniref:DUF4132 domain-containing protein n=1 Tax=Glycomyces algeriensis TaxID=256037 RepID=A0A9W6GCA8_9ACTN|nr:DUF4132 domain-containing protein [Glycomyces algeriensis]MDA1365851.1 DUF4132 domain-containing protein [Glycomyces algeriensis]MDR7351540.1 hypothetical protein [Glycomyces algeriensis]GLI44260.1 hypothetical protein GALLR39Z86_41100 [Glycomyces algeriensis]